MVKKQPQATPFAPEDVALDTLKPHPSNYQAHPDDELAHIMESIKTHGFYRNIVIAKDGTILAGHGVTEAARKLGYDAVPVIRTPYASDDPRALKLLAGDNEIRHLAEVDDRALTELLRELNESEIGLLGTGYDEMMLANLAMVTRPADEIADLDAAAQWVGMPEYDAGDGRIQIVVNFANEEDRQAFCRMLDIEAVTTAGKGNAASIWWPKRIRDDLASTRFMERKGGSNA